MNTPTYSSTNRFGFFAVKSRDIKQFAKIATEDLEALKTATRPGSKMQAMISEAITVAETENTRKSFEI